MYCRYISRNLLAYHDRRLPVFLMRLVRRHLAVCEQCQSEYEQLATLDMRLDTLASQAKVPPSVTPFEALVGRLDSVSEHEASSRQSQMMQAVNYRSRRGTRLRMAAVTACALVCLLLLPGVMPQVMVTFADVPVIGEWIQRAVIKNAGLKWAYENGYVLHDPIKLQQGAYEMTILGYVADPVQTAVIALVKGPNLKRANGESLYHVTLSIPETVCWSNSAPLETPLGGLNVVYTSPLPAGGSDVQIEMRIDGETIFTHQLFITPEPIAKASTEKQLAIADENDHYSYSLARLVATPSQYMLEFTYRNLQVRGAQLEMSTGETLSDTYPIGYGNEDGSWRKPLVFPRVAGEPVAVHLQALYWQDQQDTVIQAGEMEPLRIGNEDCWVEVQVPSWVLDDANSYSGLIGNNDPAGKARKPDTNFSIVVASHGYEKYPGGLLVEWELLTAGGKVLTQADFDHHSIAVRSGGSERYIERVKVPEGIGISGLRLKRVAIRSEPIVIPLK